MNATSGIAPVITADNESLKRDFPLKPFAIRHKYVPAHLMPRISTPGISQPRPLPDPPSPNDHLDGGRLALRFEALRVALDDLPRQASRFARWRARQSYARRRAAEATQDGRSSGRGKRTAPRWPLRPARPPGSAARACTSCSGSRARPPRPPSVKPRPAPWRSSGARTN